MSYIGNTATTQAFTPAIDYFNGDGSTVAFTLSRPVASVAQVQAVISNVPQNPGSAFTVSGSTITFTSAPPSGTQNIYVYYTSPITQVIAPGQGTVTSTSLSQGGPSWDTSGNVTLTGNITLNNGAADGAQLTLASAGYSNWNIDNYSGRFRWYYNATEYMTLDTSGNLGVGTTSPVARVHARTGASSALSDSRYIVRAEGSSEAYLSAAANDYVGVRFPNASSASQAYIDYYHGINSMIFGVNNSERARIDSSGNLLVGTTVSPSGIGATISTAYRASSCTLSVQAANGAGYDARIYMECPGSNAGLITYVRSSSRLYASSQTENSGPYVVANGTSWTTNSDARLKQNVQNIGYGLTSVLSLLPKEYEYKIDEGKKRLGFIAQDVVGVIPEIVDVPESEDDMMGIEYTGLIPVLVKAIQELNELSVEQQTIINAQQAALETLTSRITALENK